MSLLPSPINTNVILRVPGSSDIHLGIETINFYLHGNSFDKEKWKKILIERSLLNPQDDIIVNMNYLYNPQGFIMITRVSDSAGGLENNGSGFTGLPQLPKPPKTYPTPLHDAMMAEIKATYPDYPRAQNFSEDTRPEKIVQKYKQLLNEECPNYEIKFKDLVQRNPHYYLSNEIFYFRQYETLCQKQKDKGYWEEEYAKVKKIYNDLPLIIGRGRGVGGEKNRQRSKLQEIQAKINSFPSQKNLIKFPTIHNDLANIFRAGPAGAGGGGAGSAVRHQKRKQRKTQKRKNRQNRTRKNQK